MERDLTTQRLPPVGKLSEEGLDVLHEKSLEIIADIGIQVDHEEALELLEEHGATVDENNLVTVPPDLVEESIERAPESFTLHARNPDNTVTIGEGDTNVRAPVFGPPNVRTYDEGRRQSTLSDYEDFVKLAQMEDTITCSGYNICEPNDTDESIKHVEMVERNLTHTDLPIMGSNYGADRARASIEMAGIANEDRDVSRPYVMGLANGVPPRRWDEKMIGGLLEYAKHGQPIIIAPVVMAAASGPATIAGAMALQNANILIAVVIAQLKNPGTPVLYGVPAANIDVRYGTFTPGSPESSFFVSAAGQLGRYYGIPTRAGGAITDSKVNDTQSGSESMYQLMIAMLSDIDFQMLASGYLESASAASLEKFVLDAELIRYVDRFREGYDLTEETFALDLIEEVDPDGHFLNKRHTLEHSKSEFYFPDVFDRQSHDDWQDDGEKTAYELAHERVETLLDTYEKPDMPDDVRRELQEYAENERERILA